MIHFSIQCMKIKAHKELQKIFTNDSPQERSPIGSWTTAIGRYRAYRFPTHSFGSEGCKHLQVLTTFAPGTEGAYRCFAPATPFGISPKAPYSDQALLVEGLRDNFDIDATIQKQLLYIYIRSKSINRFLYLIARRFRPALTIKFSNFVQRTAGPSRSAFGLPKEEQKVKTSETTVHCGRKFILSIHKICLYKR